MAQLSVKVYHIENKTTKEIRKFSVDEDVAASYEYLVGKIRQVFPDLLKKDLELFWKDEEDDYISVSSDEELRQASHSIPPSSDCLKMYVKVKEEYKHKVDDVEHPCVKCDECDSNVKGIRYNCTVCDNYDLCSNCESKGLHPEDHELLCIKTPHSNDVALFVMRPPFGRGFHAGRGGPAIHRGGPFNPRGLGPHGGRGRPGCHRGGPFDPRGPGPRGGIAGPACHRGGPFDPRGCGPRDGRSGVSCNRGGPFDPRVLYPLIGRGRHSCHRGVPYPQGPSGFGGPCGPLFGVGPFGHCDSEDPELQGEHSWNGEHEEMEREGFDKMVGHVAHCFGLDAEHLKEITKSLFESYQSKSESNEEQVTVDDELKDQKASKSDENMEMDLHKTESSTNSQNAKAEKTDNFTYVDSTLLPEAITDEQKYEQQLEKAIQQMSAMGFDNDGGWLRQLLISKDLNVGKVLDALNPSL